MALGPGKYDEECSSLREKIQAEGVLLIVFQGNRGSGFSAVLTGDLIQSIPSILRRVADDIEKDNATLTSTGSA